MKKQSLKKHVAFIIAIMVFSLLPEFAAAQNGKGTKCNKIPCPPGYICVNGYCRRYFPFFTDSSTANGPVSISPANSNVTSIQPLSVQNENGPKCKDGTCPPRYFCMNGYCIKYVFFTDSSSVKESVRISAVNPNAINLQLIQTQNVPVKMYDETGGFVKKIANRRISEGYTNSIAANGSYY